ncbi:RNA dependent RNA polymerase-domain-containing protein [Crassisporium funariophilum]|nr:RNA dependent RNA polymerase-domain-containing protein [Crassisporium funariophilum]
MSSRLDSSSNSPLVVDVESSDSSDDSWDLAPYNKGSHGRSATPRGRDLHSPSYSVSNSRSTSSPWGTTKGSPKMVGKTASPSQNALISDTLRRYPSSNPSTPSRSLRPGGRGTSITPVFSNRLKINSPSPSSTTPRTFQGGATKVKVGSEVIVVSDSDEELESTQDLTDTDVSQPPTRSSSFYDKTTSKDSSMSSINSLFSAGLPSSSSSVSSMGSFDASSSASLAASSKRTFSPIRRLFLPKSGSTGLQYCEQMTKSPASTASNDSTLVEDLFSPRDTSHSPNVTQRKGRNFKPAQSAPPAPLPTLPDIEVPEAVSLFAQSPIGTDLKHVVIAHCDETQQLLDENCICWGTQYELARGVCTGAWTWADVREHVVNLVGDNAHVAPKVHIVMRGRQASSVDRANLFLWQELDREQAAIDEGKSRGLGLMGEWKGVPEWYGGQIQQLARLVKVGDSMKVLLEPMEKRRSHRFARFYGSRRFLQLRIPDDLLKTQNKAVKEFLVAKFILCGRVFVPFHSKDGGLYMVETNEDFGRQSQRWCSDHHRLSYRDFINWHNPLFMKKNASQIISKYVTRFALGLSNSVPALQFETDNIMYITDITASDWPAEGKNPPAEKLMTDGCGLINQTALIGIVKLFGYESLPAGVQGRIDGSKGFWILHPTDKSNVPKIWIRDSQNKIKSASLDRAHCIFDLLCPSRPSSSIALSAQSIVNLYSNGIPNTILVDMMREGLEDEVAPLLQWTKPHAMVFLWDAVNKCGNVSGTRTHRLASSLNRALGLTGRDWGRDGASEEPDQAGLEAETNDLPAATYTGRNLYSGAPLALHESAIELIQAGFHPAQNQLLHNKIGWIVRLAIRASVEKYRIPINESLGAFVVPDPLGVLEEGTIFYRSSRPLKNPRTEILYHVLEGEVLVGRYPIQLPSDMQKVVAVDVRELYDWPDVVIISTRGTRSIANLLAGGDMDGDELIVLWDPLLVSGFDNKPFTDAPKDFLSQNFYRDTETVEHFCDRALSLSPRKAHEAFQEVLIANLSESKVGLYSMFHDNAIVKHGYGNELSIRLAYIFATLLDSSKSGYRLKDGVFEQDRKKFGFSLKGDPNQSNGLDILADLKVAGDAKGQELISRYDSTTLHNRFQWGDADLKKPYATSADYALKAFDRKVAAFSEELATIKTHVDAAYKLYCDAVARSSRKATQESPSKSGRNTRPKADQEDLMLVAARKYAEPIVGLFLTPNVDQVKASYAYTLKPPFGFSVAFQELCHIKAVASSTGQAPTLRVFDEAKTLSASFLRALTRCEDEQDLVAASI